MNSYKRTKNFSDSACDGWRVFCLLAFQAVHETGRAMVAYGVAEGLNGVRISLEKRRLQSFQNSGRERLVSPLDSLGMAI